MPMRVAKTTKQVLLLAAQYPELLNQIAHSVPGPLHLLRLPDNSWWLLHRWISLKNHKKLSIWIGGIQDPPIFEEIEENYVVGIAKLRCRSYALILVDISVESLRDDIVGQTI